MKSVNQNSQFPPALYSTPAHWGLEEILYPELEMKLFIKNFEMPGTIRDCIAYPLDRVITDEIANYDMRIIKRIEHPDSVEYVDMFDHTIEDLRLAHELYHAEIERLELESLTIKLESGNEYSSSERTDSNTR